MELTDLKVVKTLLEKHGTGTKKSLGQNFIINPIIPRKTAALSVSPGLPDKKSFNETDFSDDLSCDSFIDKSKNVIEIGTGIGVLTKELCKMYGRVETFEIDSSLRGLLSEVFWNMTNLGINFGDILRSDIENFIKQKFSGGKADICANLPYYITTPVILRLLESSKNIGSITVMVQREAAEKMCAPCGSEHYGQISAIIAYYGRIVRYYNVPPHLFYPTPKVTSTVLKIDIYEKKPLKPKNEALLFKLISAVFEQRRKTLVNVICAGFPEIKKEAAYDMVRNISDDINIRGEVLDIRELCSLTDHIYGYIQ